MPRGVGVAESVALLLGLAFRVLPFVAVVWAMRAFSGMRENHGEIRDRLGGIENQLSG